MIKRARHLPQPASSPLSAFLLRSLLAASRTLPLPPLLSSIAAPRPTYSPLARSFLSVFTRLRSPLRFRTLSLSALALSAFYSLARPVAPRARLVSTFDSRALQR